MERLFDALQNPMVVYAISFALVVGLAFLYGRKLFVKWIDGEIAKIRDELDAAHALRRIAEQTLEDCKIRQAQAESEAAGILVAARGRAEAVRKKADADLAAMIARREELASERIRLAETDALTQIRIAAIEQAAVLARRILSEKLTPETATLLVEEGITEVPSLKRIG